MKGFVGAIIVLLCVLVCLPAYAEGTIADMAERWVGDEEAAVVEAVCFEIGEEENIDPWLIAVVWKYEAGFRKNPPGFHKGGLQLNPKIHFPRFEEYGFDTTYWKDWIRYGVHLWRLSDDNGKSLRQALSPWAVRSKAIRLYTEIRGTADGWNVFPVTDEEESELEGDTYGLT